MSEITQVMRVECVPVGDYYEARLINPDNEKESILISTMHQKVERKFNHLFELWITNLGEIVQEMIRDCDPKVTIIKVAREDVKK